MKKSLYIFFTFLFLLFIVFSFAGPTLATDPNTDNNCKWTSERTDTSPETGVATITGGCGDDEIRSDGNKCPGKAPENSYTGGTTLYVCCCPKTTVENNINKTPDLNPLGNLQIKIPGLDDLAKKHPVKCETNSDGVESCQIPWIAVYVTAIYNYLLGIGGILAAIALMVGGVIWLVSAGNASRVTEAKSWITGSITGIVILLTSYILLNQINPELIGMQYLKLETINPIVAETELTPALDFNGAGLYPENKWVSLSSHSNIVNNASGKTNPELANAILKAADCMKKKGYKIKISSLSRTVKEQAKLYDENYTHETNACGNKKEKKSQTCCPYPTQSKLCPHTSGSAVDMWGLNKKGVTDKDAQYQLQNCMFAAGACLLNTECWHFEMPVLSSSACKTGTNNLNGSFCKDVK